MHREKSVLFRFELVSEALLNSIYKDIRIALLKADPIVSIFYEVRISEINKNAILVRVVLNPEVKIESYLNRHIVPSIGLCAGKYTFTLIDYTEIDRDDRDIESQDELFTYELPASVVSGFICNMDYKDYED